MVNARKEEYRMRRFFQNRWAVILAGGDGVRLRSLTRFVSGDERPKQFCPLLGGRTLLTRTKERVSCAVSEDRTLFVVLSSHEPFYRDELQHVRSERILAQPANRGTLPAILWSLLSIRKRDPDAVVGFFPSDHHYAEEDRFLAGIDLAFDAALSHGSVVLVGAAARYAAPDYGWIEAEAHISDATGVLRVKRFWEKPSLHVAQQLLERGCIWNTFVMLGRVEAFLDLIQAAEPEIFEMFHRVFESSAGDKNQSFAAAKLDTLYQRLNSADFSNQVLSRTRPNTLGVFSLGDVGWTDLGDPGRVMTLAAGAGMPELWNARWGQHALSGTN